jgi:archaellum biogenesis protein FlaJ (TadC family)
MISCVVLITCIFASFVGIIVALDGRNIAVLVLSWCLLKLIYVSCITFTVPSSFISSIFLTSDVSVSILILELFQILL